MFGTATEVKKSKGGRKSIRLSKSMIKSIQQMISEGYLERQVWQTLGISNNTWYKWKGRNEDLINAISAGRQHALIDVEDKLRVLALGEQVVTEKIEMINAVGDVVSTIQKEKRPGPDMKAIAFTLSNCMPEKYSQSGESEINVTMVQAPLYEKTDLQGSNQVEHKELNKIAADNTAQPVSALLPINAGSKRESRAIQDGTERLKHGVKLLQPPKPRPTGPYKRKNEIIVKKKTGKGGGGGTNTARGTQ